MKFCISNSNPFHLLANNFSVLEVSKVKCLKQGQHMLISGPLNVMCDGQWKSNDQVVDVQRHNAEHSVRR